METVSDDRKAIVLELGAQVAELRSRKGVSVRELSRRTGINPWQIAALERGERDAHLSTLARLVGALGTRLVFEEIHS